MRPERRLHEKVPSIYFAVHCASFSCPKLRNEAYTAEQLDRQLDEEFEFMDYDRRLNEVVKYGKTVMWGRSMTVSDGQ